MAAAREQVGVLRCAVRSSRLLVLAGLLAVAASTAAHAGPVRCTGADGKVVYSDQPCVQGQTAAEVKGVPAGGPSSTTTTGASSGGDTVRSSSPSVQDVQNKAQRGRVHASLSPECRALGDRASRSVQSDSSASMDEVKRAVSQFEDKCGDQVMEATRKESARAGGGSGSGGKSKPDAATCRGLREALSTDRARLGRMTDKEKMAFVAQQNEVSVACP